MNFNGKKYINSYIIHVKLKNYIFFWRDYYNIINFSVNFIQKYEFYTWVYFKGGTKSEDEKLLGTKSWRKILEGLKWKVVIFIGTKNIFNNFFSF